MAGLLLALAALLQATPAIQPAKGSPEQRARWEAGQARQREFEDGEFARAGLPPITPTEARRRTVRRAQFNDPYFMLPIPGVEIERLAGGGATLRVTGRGMEAAPVLLPAGAWGRLAALEKDVLRPPRRYISFDPPDLSRLPPPPGVCHGWVIRFLAVDRGRERRGSGSECYAPSDDPGRAYGQEIARLALATRPACTVDTREHVFFAFARCFRPRR